jgi:hypothetical protein
MGILTADFPDDGTGDAALSVAKYCREYATAVTVEQENNFARYANFFQEWFGLAPKLANIADDCWYMIGVVRRMATALSQGNLTLRYSTTLPPSTNALAYHIADAANLKTAKEYWSAKGVNLGGNVDETGSLVSLSQNTILRMAEIGLEIQLSSAFFAASYPVFDTATRDRCRIETMLHEVSHIVGPTLDMKIPNNDVARTRGVYGSASAVANVTAYGIAGAKHLAAVSPKTAQRNAENVGYFVYSLGKAISESH